MPESKPLLTAQTEKPNHYSYLKEFRVDQCPLFLQHKCTQHRPYTCFHWHFMNQRRRRPVRKRDGAFNYSADNYCTKFDETTGLCPDGDDCQFLHRTAGDTERRYHLRYYKTCMCVHDTDSRGYCVKNGPHCAFAHGNNDIRPPVFDIKEIQAAENQDAEGNGTSNGPNVLDKERNLMNEDPKWQDTNYVLANYKTEQCKRPPRLCRQGYACPQFHNSRDKRRSPRKFKYRSTPCPSVKHGDEWGEPSSCDAGDSCQYCHTRTEQQFHPEIYKSTKCNDVQQAGYCPRGVFCAFAHVDQEMCIARDLAAPHDSGTNLGDILSNALPSVDNRPPTKPEDKGSESPNGSSEVSESASTSSLCSNGSHSRAPGAQLAHNRVENNHFHPQNSAQELLNGGVIRNEILAIDNDPSLDTQEKDQRKQSLYRAFSSSQTNSLNPLGLAMASSFYGHNDTIESVVGNALEELHLDDAINLAASMDREYETESPTIANPISASLSSGLSSGLLVGSAPVNIPGSSLNDRTNCLGNFSPSTSSPLHHIQSSFLSASRFPHQESLDSNPAFLNHLPLSSSASKISGSHFPMTNVNSGSVGSVGPGPVGSNLFDFHNLSPGSRGHPSVANSFPISPSIANNSPSEIHKLREELSSSRSKLATWDENLSHLRSACEAWQQEAADRERRAKVAELQRDEVLKQLKVLQMELERLQNNPYVHTLNRASDLRCMSIPMLKALQAQLRTDLEEIDKVLYHQTAAKCMVCEEQDRSVTLRPCNHLVLCILCAPKQKECPYCQTPISPNATTVS